MKTTLIINFSFIIEFVILLTTNTSIYEKLDRLRRKKSIYFRSPHTKLVHVPRQMK